MSTLRWQDADEIGARLLEQHPEQHPLQIGFSAMHKLICALPGFSDDPKASNEGVLEAIQMAWYDEWKVDHGA